MEREIITIRGEKKIVKTDGVYLLGDRAGQKWDKEQWNYWLKSMEADLCNTETSEEYIAGLKHIYSEHQRGLANESNFFWNTVAMFEQVNSRPRRKPDYISKTRDGKISSEYWFSDEGVIRGSNHWGDISTCDWALKGTGLAFELTLTPKVYGKAKWSEFVQKSQEIIVDGEFLGRTDFENTIGREKIRIDDIIYEKFGNLGWIAEIDEKHNTEYCPPGTSRYESKEDFEL